MGLKKFAKQVITKTPGLRSVYSRFRPVLWGHGSRETYRNEFAEFIAQRRNIDLARARALITQAEQQFAGGWSGDAYRHFTEVALETFRPLYDDSTDAEALATYRFHAGFDFLRMLGYSVPTPKDMQPILSRLSDKKQVAIVDYGFGLAQRTIMMARCLLDRRVQVKLYLVDIRKDLHLSFVDFLCRKYHIDYEFIEVTADHLYPELPPHDYCDNVSVLEHVRQPVTVIDNTDRVLRPGGLLLALVNDAVKEMMHISPNLAATRARLAELGYQQVATCYGTPLFRKPLG